MNTITLQPPYQLSASSHYSHSLSVTSICPSWLPPRMGFYSTPRTCPCVSAPRGQVHAPARLTSITRHRSASWADHVISFPAARARMSRLACHLTPTRYWNVLTPGPSWIGSNTGLAYKSPPQVNWYTCWAGSAPTTTTHAANWDH